MKKLYSIVTNIVLITIMVASQSGCDVMVVEYKDVAKFSIEEKKINNEENAVTISGHITHSSLSVKEVIEKYKNEEINLMVLLTPARRELSSHFKHQTIASKTIKKITFGQNRHVIWQRDDHEGERNL